MPRFAAPFAPGRPREALALTGGYIEPIPCGERRWAEDDGSPVIEIARREGIEVCPVA